MASKPNTRSRKTPRLQINQVPGAFGDQPVQGLIPEPPSPPVSPSEEAKNAHKRSLARTRKQRQRGREFNNMKYPERQLEMKTVYQLPSFLTLYLTHLCFFYS